MTLHAFIIIAAGLIGLSVGSFLNVVIARRAHEDWRERGSVDGRSACPSCGGHIAWYDNVPVVSWLVLRARCRSCEERISIRYPLVELGTAVVWASVAAAASDIPSLVTGLVFMTILIPISAIDLELRIIPDELNYVAAWAGFACSLGFGPQPRFVAQDWWWLEVVLSAGGVAAFLLLPSLLTRGRGMGMGDVKLAVALGAFLGAPVVVGMLAGFLAALVPSMLLIARHGVRRGRRSTIPFGPFLALGGAVGWFYGAQLLDAYLNLI